MNKKIFISFLLFISAASVSYGQDSERPARPNVPGSLIFDIGFNTLNNDSSIMDIRTLGSRSFNVYYYYDIQVAGSKFFIMPGIGLGIDKYRFDNPVTVGVTSANPDETIVFELDSLYGNNITKSTLAVSHLDIPLEIRFYANPEAMNRSFYAGIGGKAGIRYSSNTKVKYEMGDEDVEVKTKRSYNLSDFRYGATLRIGYGSFGLYAYYGLNELFKDGRSPGKQDLSTISFGLTINGF